MKKSELNQFTAVLQPIDGWYTALKRGEKCQVVVTDAKYAARFTFRAQDEGAVYYRLEDLKEQSALLGNARKGPQENDLTVLDHAIFQFELKKVKNLSDTHLTSQFPNGKHWTRELLWLAGLSTWGQKAKVYNVLIRLNDKGRPSLSRSKSSVHVNNRDNQPYVEVIWYRDRATVVSAI